MRVVATAAVLAAMGTAISGADVAFSPWLDIVGATAYLLALFAFGYRARWRAVVAFAVAFAVASVLHEWLFWHDDPVLGGMDDPPPTSAMVFVLPALLAAIGPGTLARRARATKTTIQP